MIMMRIMKMKKKRNDGWSIVSYQILKIWILRQIHCQLMNLGREMMMS